MKVLDPVSVLLRQKGGDVYSLPSDASVYSAIEMMAEKHVGALLVVDDGYLIGIVSERDYARKVILKGRSSKDTFVREIMTPNPLTIRCDTSHHIVEFTCFLLKLNPGLTPLFDRCS